MQNKTLRVFVSATTQDLVTAREAVGKELFTAEILPVTQEYFGPDYRSLIESLRDKISSCDVVICLIGFVYGAEPPKDSVEIRKPTKRRSYTQLEYDFSIQCEKPVFVFLANENYLPDKKTSQGSEEKNLQLQHREDVLKKHKCEQFSDIHVLKPKVAHAIRIIKEKFSTPLELQTIFYRHNPRIPGYFVGRTREMQQLAEALKSPKPSIIVVVGMGGQGKTTLVYQALQDLKNSKFKAGFWCTAYRGGYTFDMFLDDVLVFLLKKNFDKRNKPDVNARMLQLVNILQQEQYIIVIDGIERWLWGWNRGIGDPQFVETTQERMGIHEGLDDFLQQTSGLFNGTHIIITTRALPAALDNVARTHIPVREESGDNMSLEGLDSESAIDLLIKQGVKGTQDELKMFAEKYANHPLALTIVGSLLGKKYGGLLERFPSSTSMDPRYELFKLFDEIRKNLPGREVAEHFLKVASLCFENPTLQVIAAGITEKIANNNMAIDNLLEVAVTLADWNIICWDGVKQTVSLHPLIKNYFGSLVNELESKGIHQRLSMYYVKCAIPKEATQLKEVSSRILAIKHAAFAGNFDCTADLLFAPMIEDYSLFTWLGSWGHQFSGIELLGELSSMAKDELRGVFLLGQAQMYHQLARPQLATENINESIAIFERLSISGSQGALANLAKALATMGNVYRETGDSTKAILDFDRAIEILERIENNTYDKDADLEKILTNYEKQKITGIRNTFSDFSINLSNKININRDTIRAVLDFSNTIEIPDKRKNISINSKLDLAQILVNRGNALRTTGNLNRALLDFNRACKILKKLSTENLQYNELLVAPILINRGITFLELHNVECAIKDFENSINICIKHYNKLNQETIRHISHAKSMLGIAFMVSKETETALKYASEAVSELQKLTDEGRKDFEHFFALSLINRAKIYISLKEWNNALHDCDRSINIYYHLFTDAGEHFTAALAHALCTRAIVRYCLGDIKGFEKDFSTGFGSMKKLLCEWKSESEIRIGFLRDALRAINYLLPERKEGISLLEEILEEINLYSRKDLTEALRKEVVYSIQSIEKLKPKLEVSGYKTLKLRDLIEKVKLIKKFQN